jgi:hypothetical protein
MGWFFWHCFYVNTLDLNPNIDVSLYTTVCGDIVGI